MRRSVAIRCGFVAALLAAALGVAGCHPAIFAIPFADREAKTDVKARHHLTAERLLILPYLSADVEFENPTAGTDVAGAIVREIHTHLRGRVHRVVHPAHVTKYQRSTLGWETMGVAEIGREFEVDKVLYLEIHRFSIMEEHSANLYRGRVAGTLQVVDCAAPPGREVLFETDVSIEVPEDRPIGALEISEFQLRGITIARFAQEVIWNFYDHTEKGGQGVSS